MGRWTECWQQCTTCSSTLTLKNFTRKGESIYCAQHVPKEGHTQVADSVLTAHSTKSQAANMGGKIAKVCCLVLCVVSCCVLCLVSCVVC